MAKQRHDASYVVHTVRALLDGTGGDRDWDVFTSCSLRDPQLDNIRMRALKIDLPCGREEIAELELLALEAEQVARG